MGMGQGQGWGARRAIREEKACDNTPIFRCQQQEEAETSLPQNKIKNAII